MEILKGKKYRLTVTWVTLALIVFYYLAAFHIIPYPFWMDARLLEYDWFYLSICVPVFLGVWFLHGNKCLQSLGLTANFGKGFLYAAISVLPMLGYMTVAGDFNSSLPAIRLFNRTFAPGFFEELIFRGLLLGQLFRYAGWGFAPSIGLNLVVFGALHLNQGHDLLSALAAMGVTGLGAIFFGWIYIETKFNLWSVAWLHALMNFSWTAFNLATNGAVGNLEVNIVRVLTIFLSIGLIIWYKRKHKRPFIINHKTLWWQTKCSESTLNLA